MLTAKANRSTPGKRAARRGIRRRPAAQSRTGRASAGGATVAEGRPGGTTQTGGLADDETRRIQIRRGPDVEPGKTAVKPRKRGKGRRRRALDAAARPAGDADDDSQLTLDLSEPKSRSYEASAKPPRERIDTTRWLWLAMGLGAATCPILLGFQLVFTNPAHGANVLAVVATMAFAALFATWTFEYWYRRGSAANPARVPVWTLTRHALLASVGVAALAVSALNRTASFGLLILIVFTLIVADVVLCRVRIR